MEVVFINTDYHLTIDNPQTGVVLISRQKKNQKEDLYILIDYDDELVIMQGEKALDWGLCWRAEFTIDRFIDDLISNGWKPCYLPDEQDTLSLAVSHILCDDEMTICNNSVIHRLLIDAIDNLLEGKSIDWLPFYSSRIIVDSDQSLIVVGKDVDEFLKVELPPNDDIADIRLFLYERFAEIDDCDDVHPYDCNPNLFPDGPFERE